MICPQCQIRWADFPVDITKEKMTIKQEADRLVIFKNDNCELCPMCQFGEEE